MQLLYESICIYITVYQSSAHTNSRRNVSCITVPVLSCTGSTISGTGVQLLAEKRQWSERQRQDNKENDYNNKQTEADRICKYQQFAVSVKVVIAELVKMKIFINSNICKIENNFAFNSYTSPILSLQNELLKETRKQQVKWAFQQKHKQKSFIKFNLYIKNYRFGKFAQLSVVSKEAEFDSLQKLRVVSFRIFFNLKNDKKYLSVLFYFMFYIFKTVRRLQLWSYIYDISNKKGKT